MAITVNLFVSSMLTFGLLTMVSLDLTDGQMGVCYGDLSNALPSATEVVKLYQKHNIQKMRIFGPKRRIMEALQGSSIELVIGVPNEDLENLASCQDNADTWVREYVVKYPYVKFTHVVVGNEVSPANNSTQYLVPFVLPAMQNIYNAICTAGMRNQIKVSTNIDTRVLDKSYPPSEGVFRSDVTSYLNPIIQHLINTDAPLFVCIYPYFAYIGDPKHINLQYALLQPNSGIYVPGGIYYDNLFYAIVDALYAALEKTISRSGLMGRDRRGSSPHVVASETGWPSDGGHKRRRRPRRPRPPNQLVTKSCCPSSGGPDEDAIESVKNARIYNNNLIRIVKNGTPKRPGKPIETYIFAMFDENLKPGDETEKHFGIFYPNGQPKYPLRFS